MQRYILRTTLCTSHSRNEYHFMMEKYWYSDTNPAQIIHLHTESVIGSWLNMVIFPAHIFSRLTRLWRLYLASSRDGLLHPNGPLDSIMNPGIHVLVTFNLTNLETQESMLLHSGTSNRKDYYHPSRAKFISFSINL